MAFTKKHFLLWLGSLWIANMLLVGSTSAAVDLVKSQRSGAVYYLDANSTRHVFPNQTTFESWFGKDYSKIVTVSDSFLANYPLGKNITIRPGTFLVKTRTSPEVYAIEEGGILRKINSEQIAKAIYGLDWTKRVVDVPEEFFNDYKIGKPITHDYIIPDNVLIKNSQGEYFYKRFDVVQKFQSVAAVVANNLSVVHTVSTDRSFVSRPRPIIGKQASLQLLTAEPLYGKVDCENKNLKAANIFLSKQAHYQVNNLTKLEKIKNQTPARFNWVSHGFSDIDVSYQTVEMIADEYLVKQRNDGTYDINTETLHTFYEQHPDIFDFIVIWTDFPTPGDNTNEIARFIPVTNALEGNGKPLLDRAASFGSRGKLKGIILMGNLDKYDISTERNMNQTLNYLMHEILHQWSAYIKFKDQSNNFSDVLLRQDDLSHWSYYAGFVSPLGGGGWIDNADGTFTSSLSSMVDTGLRKFSMIDLYAMGHIPRQLMPDVFYVQPDVPGDSGNIIKGKAVFVNIDQIVAAHGEIRCTIR